MTITIDALKKIRTAIIHHNSPGSSCPDGMASAILIHDALPEIPIRFVNHSELESTVHPEPGLLFCDICPDDKRALQFESNGCIVLDHHVQQKDTVLRFHHGVYSDEPGVSGAMLAYRHVWAPLFEMQSTPSAHVKGLTISRAFEFARLAGIRDTWQKSSERWPLACEQAEALRFYPAQRLLDITEPFDTEHRPFTSLLFIGPILIEKRSEKTSAMMKRVMGGRTNKGTVIGYVNTLETSDLAEHPEASGLDVLAGFSYTKEHEGVRLILSLRGRHGYDVGSIAKRFGGGGHKGAAGCTVDYQADKGPIRVIREMFDQHEAEADL